jgi:hypothetical protein
MRQKVVYNKLLTDLSSEDYHGMEGTYSSSQLKTMLEDPEIFYKKYIVKETERGEIPAFSIGTFFHTAVLEPHLVDKECTVYTGAVRRGKDWEAFKEENKGKTIITKTEKATVEKLVAAVKDSPISMEFLKNSVAEISTFVEVYVLGGEVFGFRDDVCYALVSDGWCPTSLDFEEEDIKEFGVKIVLKVRADALDKERGIIADLKSTTGNAKDEREMKQKVASLNYDLSATFYLDIFTLSSGITFDTWVWIFASKDYGNARSYVAGEKNKMIERAKWKKAVVLIAKYIENGWEFTDELGEIEATMFNMEWLN